MPLPKNLLPFAIAAALLATMGPAPAAVLSSESAIQLALSNNRDLQAARFAVWKAKGRLAQAGKWPNPELELSGMSDVVFRNEGAGAFTVGLAQTFPLTARLSLTKKSARVDVLRALREIRDRERLLIAEVRATTIEILESQARAKTLADLLAASKKSATLAEERLSAGQGSLAEKSLSLVDQRRIANELDSARLSQNLALMKLKTLLGLGPDEPLELRGSLASAIKKPVASVSPRSIHRPDVDLLVLEEEKADIEIALARAEAWEGIRLGIQYTYDQNMDEPEGLGTDNFLGLSVSIPLPLWDQKKGLVEERTALRDETRARLGAARLEIENTLAASLRRVALLESRLAAFDSQTLAPVTKSVEEMATAFDSGRVDMRDLFIVREKLGQLRLERIALQSQLARALTDLESTTGSHPAIRRDYLSSQTTTQKK
jgi:cobalt-zinc-cadmium efflux system outer membrane protein